MTFLNWSILLGLMALGIPIVVHLLSRRHARKVPWGAMRFLSESYASRSRRIMLEEMILLAMRCLVIVLFVLAIARPFIPTRSTIPWPVLLLPLLLAGIVTGVAGACWKNRRRRNRLLAVVEGLVLMAALATLAEHYLQFRLWGRPSGGTDIVLVLDGSMSTQLRDGGADNFSRILDEAAVAVDAAGPGDALAVVLAGPSPKPVTPSLSSDRKELLRVLERLKPTGGTATVPDAMETALGLLNGGTNPNKQIVYITDGQTHGWALSEADSGGPAWPMLASVAGRTPGRFRTVYRAVGDGARMRQAGNLAIVDLAPSRSVVGIDRPVGLDVTVRNTGAVEQSVGQIQLKIGTQTLTRQGDTLQPGSAETFRFEHHFKTPGRQAVAAGMEVLDDLRSDNRLSAVIDVAAPLPVLIVDGQTARRPARRAATYFESALSPGSDRQEPDRALFDVTTLDVYRALKLKDFRGYRAVILSGVPGLPEEAAEQLGRYVTEGGLLLIAPGPAASQDAITSRGDSFYRRWRFDGRRVVPVTFAEYVTAGQSPAGVSPTGVNHPALRRMMDRNPIDLTDAKVKRYWKLRPIKDRDVSVAMRLSTGDPFVLEWPVGSGRAILLASAPSAETTDLVGRKAFVPFVHELLAWRLRTEPDGLNVEAGRGFSIVVDAPDSSQAPPGHSRSYVLEMKTPAGPRLVEAFDTTRRLRVDIPAVTDPGLYRVLLPDTLGDRYPRAGGELPFAVRSDPRESNLAPLEPSALAALPEPLGMVTAGSTAELRARISGEYPGAELWKYLALAALAALLAELVVSRWIAVQRKGGSGDELEFDKAGVDSGWRLAARRRRVSPRRSRKGAPL